MAEPLNKTFRLPNVTQRVAVYGRTGSGKTRFAAWLLSMAAFDKVPFVVVDYKLEALFTQSDRIKEIRLGEVPKHPGVYVMRPLPTDDDAVEAWLWKVHQRENCGIYVDEGYGIDRYSKALRAVLTQGRSKRLPVIYISQRPAHISPFVTSEADFLAVFPLTMPQDQQKVREIVPGDPFAHLQEMPPYNSYFFDVGRNVGFDMLPVPSDDEILNRLDMRLATKRKAL